MNIEFTDENIARLFGSEYAEGESIDRLKEYFLKKDTYSSVTSNLKLRILVGHKGTGKSALFKVAMNEDLSNSNLPILIKPDDIREVATDRSEFNLRIRQWKEGLISIIKNKVFSAFDISDDGNKYIPMTCKLISFLVDTFSKINLSANLDPTKQKLYEKFLTKRQIIVYIDDLDRGWNGSPEDIERISALLNAVRDLSDDNEGLLFKISLRTDVYYLVRTSDESTDKIESSVVWCDWENHEIFVLLIKRILTFFSIDFDEDKLLKTNQSELSKKLDCIMDTTFYGKGKWMNKPMYNVLLSLIRRRPRDMVKLCTLAAKKAYKDNSNKILTSHLNSIFSEYSQGRMQDTINEYKSELPNIKSLLFGMKPNSKQNKQGKSFVYTYGELIQKLKSISNSSHILNIRQERLTAEQMAEFLYKINFITATKKTDKGIDRKYFETNQYLLSAHVNFGYDWEIHPAFRWALQPDFNLLYNES